MFRWAHVGCNTIWLRLSHDRLTNIEQHAVYQIPVILCGNKCDYEGKRQVPIEAGSQLADKLGNMRRFLNPAAFR